MDDSKWYLRKSHDGSNFGPVTLELLQQWAADAQISPLDRVSTDEKTWLKAPMVPELAMDYLVEVGPDQFYGPTTLGALREFLSAGEITPDATVTNCKDATNYKVQDFLLPVETNGSSDSAGIPARGNIRINLQQRIRELEEALLQERRAREMAEHHVEKLESKLDQLTA